MHYMKVSEAIVRSEIAMQCMSLEKGIVVV